MSNLLNELRAQAGSLDNANDFARFHTRFFQPEGKIYLDGNSLGLLSRDAEQCLLRVVEEWRRFGIEAWTKANPPWFEFAERLSAQVAPFVGAEPSEVIVANSTTVNLHQILATLFQPSAGRDVLLADALNFPSDLYAMQSHLRLRGLNPDTNLRMVQSADGFCLDEADILTAMTADVAMIVLPSVLYCSGQLLDMERLTQEANARGILIGFDCSHSIGVVPHHFDAWGTDFAFWCHYKYMNAGPGSVAGLYLNRRHLGTRPGLAGWFGSRKERQFAMLPQLEPAEGAGALQIGTPPILSLAPLEGALAIMSEAGIQNIRATSLQLTAFLWKCLETLIPPSELRIVTPEPSDKRGGHIALQHEDSEVICRALRLEGIIPDFRPPNLIRFAPIPLYNSFRNCCDTAETLANLLHSRTYLNLPSSRDAVT